jgi:dipeptide transport system ATP-binding protein
MTMIFQEPMSSLNPCFTVGFQMGEALKTHLGMDKAARKARSIELLRSPSASPIPSAPRFLSAPVVRRHERSA